VVTNGSTTTYGYDGWGRRIRKTVGGTRTDYLHDGAHLAVELDAAGKPVREYTYYAGLDQPHSMRRVSDNAVFYYTWESPGHVTGLVGSTKLANEYQYTPWGEALRVKEDVPQPLRYAGREYDAESGLYYVRARYYDPELGRFNSEDPIGLAGGINPYVYAGNDPVNSTDPLGLCAQGYRRYGGTVAGLQVWFSCPRESNYRPGALLEIIPNEEFLRDLAQLGEGESGQPQTRQVPALDIPQTCGDVAPMPSNTPNNPYPEDYKYRGISGRHMFRHGGNGAWGQIARSCLVCMYQEGVEPAPAHDYCYAAADRRVSAGESFKGYARAGGAAFFWIYQQVRIISNPIPVIR
jgi:RHS repeat-associated protein